ncbi:hypothetical protein CIK05_04560 [Bdellovibrio sp. qaytius]|nr:hypothetical protein CIK05_04560 [Bdellovibrio sp. qaytius]
MKYWGILILLSAHIAMAQTVVPLFRDNSLTTYVTMPFRLKAANGSAIPILSIEVLSSKDHCQAMIDPMISANFLVKCTKTDSLRIAVYYKNSDGSVSRINYGPVTVAKISASEEVLTPVVDNSQKYKAGKDLFASTCMGCHQSPQDKPNRSVSQIKSAIAGITRMKSIKLTDTQVKSISDYLNNLD